VRLFTQRYHVLEHLKNKVSAVCAQASLKSLLQKHFISANALLFRLLVDGFGGVQVPHRHVQLAYHHVCVDIVLNSVLGIQGEHSLL